MTVVLGLLVWIATFLGLVAAHEHRARRQGDPAWKPTGTRLTTEAGYDQQKALAMVKRAKRHSATGRRLTKPTRTPEQPAKTVPFRRRGA